MSTDRVQAIIAKNTRLCREREQREKFASEILWEAERQTLKAKRLEYLRQLYLSFELENMTFDEFLSENGYEP